MVSMLHKHSDFSADLEDLAHRVIGCCIAVHRELGPGLIEAAYARAVRVELAASNIPFESEKRYPILYRGNRSMFIIWIW
jgi:GxxExxY protein